MRQLFRIPVALGLVVILVLGTVGSSVALPNMPPGLVFLNKLGSQTEVLNSEFGADFAISSLPEVKFFPGQYGGSFGTEAVGESLRSR